MSAKIRSKSVQPLFDGLLASLRASGWGKKEEELEDEEEEEEEEEEEQVCGGALKYALFEA